jgi:hypothetical protein
MPAMLVSVPVGKQQAGQKKNTKTKKKRAEKSLEELSMCGYVYARSETLALM